MKKMHPDQYLEKKYRDTLIKVRRIVEGKAYRITIFDPWIAPEVMRS